MPSLRQHIPHRTTWADVYWRLTSLAPGSNLEVNKLLIEHPSYNGATRSIGMPQGQVADWRFPPDPEGRGLHVHDVGWGWRAHLDQHHPLHSPVRHFLKDVL